MPNRWADEPESSVDQPKTDLNPLLNPLLEENLGRWAQVYFTNPPETRERAVMDLLRELENRQPSNGHSAEPHAETAPSETPASAKNVCPVCSRENREDQKYCGFCGSPTNAHAFDAPLPVNSENAISFTPEAASEPAREPITQTAEPLSFLGLSQAPAAPDNELDSLRDRSFDKSYYEPDSGRHRGLYIAAAVLILVGGVTYLTWPMMVTHLPLSWQEAILRPPSRVTAAAPRVNEPATPPTAPPLPVSADSSSTQPVPAPAEAKPEVSTPAKKKAADEAVETASKSASDSGADSRSVRLASEAQSSRPGEGGGQELAVAERYLKSSHSQVESSEAARWLWKSVGKQNSRAAVLLADLYVRGDGVSRNCDEARILLGAAARRGLTEAAQKLSSLDSTCH